MVKVKTVYTCTECGAQAPQWAGQCSDCGVWNTLIEETAASPPQRQSRFAGYAPGIDTKVQRLIEVALHDQPRFMTGLSELDRALGGGLVAGSVVLIGGNPGIGKSTLLLQALCHLSQQSPALYVTGEESLQQVAMRSHRIGLPHDKLQVVAETQVERIVQLAMQSKPRFMVVDSIQTVYTELLQSAPGSVGQVRESAAQLVRYAKQMGTALFLVGHVTKEGTLAGPRVLEHMVDTVLYFEGESESQWRIIRAVKNRFGAVNELGVFGMTERGLREVSNPSAIFLSRAGESASGSVVTVTWEGSRPLLVEVQALVDESHLANPRRVTVGLEQNRLAMLLAVLHRHGGVASYNQDVFVNVVGGVRIIETAADLALLFAILSSLKNRPLPADLVLFGEVGLSGEIRPVQSGQERLREVAKHGFKRAIVPSANKPKKNIEGLQVIAVSTLAQALQHF
ncbi:MAG: DNA repair protein RadA [Gammaproteobacteria bacterium]